MKRINLVSFVILILAVVLFVFNFIRQTGGGDRLAPIIRMDETNIEVSIKDGEDALLKGVSATDVKDGGVTDSLIVENISDFLEDGRRLVTLAAFDSDNHVATATRQITYSDYTAPHFSMEAPLVFTTGTTSFLENVTAMDCLDGDITSAIQFSQGYELYADEAGNYAMQIEVTNSAGDTAVLPVTITITDTSIGGTPQFVLQDYIQYAKVGESVDMAGNLTSVQMGNQEYQVVAGAALTDTTIGADLITMSQEGVDYNTPGVYEATYSYTPENGETGTTRLIIVVEE